MRYTLSHKEKIKEGNQQTFIQHYSEFIPEMYTKILTNIKEDKKFNNDFFAF